MFSWKLFYSLSQSFLYVKRLSSSCLAQNHRHFLENPYTHIMKEKKTNKNAKRDTKRSRHTERACTASTWRWMKLALVAINPPNLPRLFFSHPASHSQHILYILYKRSIYLHTTRREIEAPRPRFIIYIYKVRADNDDDDASLLIVTRTYIHIYSWMTNSRPYTCCCSAALSEWDYSELTDGWHTCTGYRLIASEEGNDSVVSVCACVCVGSKR